MTLKAKKVKYILTKKRDHGDTLLNEIKDKKRNDGQGMNPQRLIKFLKITPWKDKNSKKREECVRSTT